MRFYKAMSNTCPEAALTFMFSGQGGRKIFSRTDLDFRPSAPCFALRQNMLVGWQQRQPEEIFPYRFRFSTVAPCFALRQNMPVGWQQRQPEDILLYRFNFSTVRSMFCLAAKYASWLITAADGRYFTGQI